MDYHVTGPLHVAVNEETDEISAWGRPSQFLMMNWGMSSAPAVSVLGTITDKHVDAQGGIIYDFEFTEWYLRWNLKSRSGIGYFYYRPAIDDFSVHLWED